MTTIGVLVPLFLFSITLAHEGHVPQSYEKEKWLDIEGKYLLRWTVSPEEQTVHFSVVVATRGYVGFGVSHHGSMVQADIVIGGVYPDGTTYFSDRHGPDSSNGYPPEDDHQDWWLEYASENETHTTLGFWRKKKTCDEQDIDMTDQGPINTIYAWAEDDPDKEIPQYHGPDNRGSYTIKLYSASGGSGPSDDAMHWDFRHNVQVPSVETYWRCEIIEGPDINKKHHMIGFQPLLSTDVTYRKLVHHAIIGLCILPDWMPDAVIEHNANKGGTDCNSDMFHAMFCYNLLNGYINNPEGIFYPPDLGFPLHPRSGKTYFLIETHYNNPKLLSFHDDFGFRMYYTDKVRPVEIGVFIVGNANSIHENALIPPGQKEWMVTSHCDKQCTTIGLQEPVKVNAVLLHTHLLGRKMRVRHFRNGEELPWIASDDHFSFNSAEILDLPSEVEVQPGDHFTIECTMDSTSRNTTTIQGASTNDEMCLAFLFHYPAQELSFCMSYIEPENILRWLGIDVNVSSNADSIYLIREYVKDADSRNWADISVADYQNHSRYEYQRVLCFKKKFQLIVTTDGETTYPRVSEEYIPEDMCNIESSSSRASSETAINQYMPFIGLVICNYMLQYYMRKK